jgi:hypothetical protein
MGLPLDRQRTECVAEKLVALSEELGRESRENTSLELQTSRLYLRSPRITDLEPLCRILEEPEVAARWPGYNRERVRTELVEADPDEVTVLAIESGGGIGAIQYAEAIRDQYWHRQYRHPPRPRIGDTGSGRRPSARWPRTPSNGATND